MSLVERALKKLQESRGQTPVIPAGVVKPTVKVTAPVEGAAPTTLPRPAKSISIDRAMLRNAELLPPQHEERRLAQEYRQIKRPLVENAMGRGVPALPNGRRILVASALPGDGKTFTVINLALSLALEKDISVLLVDADVAKPHVSRIFGAAAEPGLLDALRDETADAENFVLGTDVPNLTFLPAGRHSETATEFLASNRMETLVEGLASRDPNRIILFDSPPLLLTSESRALIAIAGQVVVVVRAGGTPQQAVLDATNFIGDGKFIGLVLNQCDVQSRANYYHQYGQAEETSVTK